MYERTKFSLESKAIMSWAVNVIFYSEGKLRARSVSELLACHPKLESMYIVESNSIKPEYCFVSVDFYCPFLENLPRFVAM